MVLSKFIIDNIESILAEWERFARSLPPGRDMNAAALRDDAEQMLRFVAADMVAVQSQDEQATKARGLQASASANTAAHQHGRLRLRQSFDLAQMVSEFRALRASVISLWSAQSETNGPSSELVRFNEAIDQILAESVHRYASDVERSRELLLGVLGHDLRNPLSSIRMSAELLTRTELTPRQSQLISGMINSSERMRKMVHDLLDFTRTRLGAQLVTAPERCDVAAVCRTIADEMRSAHPDRELTVESSGHCVGSYDCARMAQLVSNLVGNAVQHGYPNTPIRITVGGDEAASVAVRVANEGQAIPASRQGSIFDPLNRNPQATTHREAGSLGLGLYIAKEIAVAHGGALKLLSSDASGTLFEVRLPRAPATA